MDGWKSPGGPRYRAPTVLITFVFDRKAHSVVEEDKAQIVKGPI